MKLFDKYNKQELEAYVTHEDEAYFLPLPPELITSFKSLFAAVQVAQQQIVVALTGFALLSTVVSLLSITVVAVVT